MQGGTKSMQGRVHDANLATVGRAVGRMLTPAEVLVQQGVQVPERGIAGGEFVQVATPFVHRGQPRPQVAGGILLVRNQVAPPRFGGGRQHVGVERPQTRGWCGCVSGGGDSTDPGSSETRWSGRWPPL